MITFETERGRMDAHPMDDDHIQRKGDAIHAAIEKAMDANEKFLRENPRPFVDVIHGALMSMNEVREVFKIANEVMPEICESPDDAAWMNLFAHIEDEIDAPDDYRIDPYAELVVFLWAVHEGAKKLDEINGVKK